jgi:hypothetical protein
MPDEELLDEEFDRKGMDALTYFEKVKLLNFTFRDEKDRRHLHYTIGQGPVQIQLQGSVVRG